MTYVMLTEDERRALRLLGLLEYPVFEPWMLAALIGSDLASALRLTESLVRERLVERLSEDSEEAPQFRLHEQVFSYARVRLAAETESFERQESAHRLADERVKRLDRVPTQRLRKNVFTWQDEGQIVLALDVARDVLALAHLKGDKDAIGLALSALAELQLELGYIDDARELSNAALNAPGFGSRARALRCLAKVKRQLRRIADAESLLATLGPDFGIDSYHLGIPDESDALEIVTAFSKVDWRQQPECAADILDMCGRLPLTLRAIGERLADREMSFREMADALKSEKSDGLARLTYGGKSIEEDLQSEYERLTNREKRAFRLLTLVGSSTFIPWVLRPLLNVDGTEAENLIAQLAEAELLEVAGPDSPLGPHSPLGVARYRFHPLARLFAQARLENEEDDSEQQAARNRLEAAYLEVIIRVLIKLDPSLARLPDFQIKPAKWLTVTLTLPSRIAELPSHWVRADYKNWMQACKAAFHGCNWGLCWRICTFLSGPIPDEPEIEQCYEVFELAGIAAEHDIGTCAHIEVLLAKGTFCLALERYREALETFELASVKISEVKSATGNGVSTMRLEAVRHRKLAEGWIQLGAYGRAQAEITEALSLAGLADERIELDRALLLRADIEGRMTLDPRDGAASPEGYSVQSDYALWFRAQLMESEVARRARNWSGAESYLKKALGHSYGDVRRTANVLYRMGRLRLNQSRSVLDTVERDARAWDAVSLVAASLNSFRSMDNAIGVVRARCLLARALATAGRLADADDELQIADSELNIVARAEEGISNPLKARLSLAQGEIWLLQQRYAEASQALSDAVTRFHEESDRWSQVEALLLRGRSERYQGQFTSANITLWAVAAAFKCFGDETGFASALEQLALTAEGMGQLASAIELRLVAQNGIAKHVSPRAAIMLARSIYGNRGRRWASEAPRDRDIHLPV